MNVIPLGNQILFRNQRNEAGAILLPQTAQGDVHSVVLAIGPDVKTIGVGDRILTGTTDLLQLPWSGEPLYLCPESSVVAKIGTEA